MKRPTLPNALIPIILGSGFIALDLVADRLGGNLPDIDLPHVFLAVLVLLISYAMMRRLLEAHRRSETALRLARDDLEIRVRERTAELEQTNEALRQATQRSEHLSSFPRLNPNPVLEIDASETVTYYNSAATEALARLGMVNDCRPFFPDDMAGILQKLDQKKEGQLQREVQVSSAIFGETIQVLPASGTVRIYAFDITERRRAEEALHESEEKFATVFRLSPDAVGIIRASDDTVLDVNEAFAALLGCERSEIIGKTWDELEIVQAAAQRDLLADLFAREGKVSGHEVEFVTQMDNVITLLITLSAVAIRGERCTLAIAHDITERKRAEEALRAAQLQAETEKHHLEAVLESLPVGVVITDAQGGVLLTNGMDEQIWGSRPTTRRVDDYVQYQAWWADSGKPVEPHEWASARAVQSGEPVFGQMLEIQRFDGRRGFVLNSAVPIRDGEGRVIGSAVAIQDITELRRAEQDLRASEEKYRLLFQNMAEGFALYELLFDEQGKPADWRVLEVNDAYVRHTGVASERIVGRRISELFPAAIPEYLPRFAAVVATQTPSDFETYAQAVDRHQHVVTFPAGGHRFASIIEDVTKRRQAEQRLAYQASLLANISDVVYATDVQLRITSWNRAAEMAFGWKEEEALGKSLVEITGWKSNPEMRAELARKMLDGGSVTAEIEHTTRSGEPIIFDSNVMLLRDAGSEVIGFVAVNRDITERRRAEQDLRNALAEMQQRQAEIAALFAGSRAVLEQRTFESTARFVFDACKTSVGAAAGYIGLMTDDGAQNQPVVLDAGDRPCAMDPSLPMPIRGLLAQAYRTGQVVYENDFASSEWAQFLPEGHACLDNVLLAPLTIEGKAVGLLGLANKAGGFGEHDAHLTAAFAELAAIALVNSRAVESLEHSEERFRSVVQADNDAIITCDSHAKIAFWNNAAERIFGYSASEITGQPLARILPSHIRQVYEENILHAFAGGKFAITGQTVESTGLRKDGTEFATEVSLTNWRTNEGLFFTVNIRDISERKRSEERLRRAQTELALGLQERAALEERQRLARELHDSVSQALYGISLGANTALTLFDVDRTKVLDALNYVLSLTQTGLMEMRALIFELRPESLEMEGLATALTKRATALAGRHGIEVVLSLCDEPDAPLAVKEALYRIAQEALQNAVKHARPDRLDVRLTCEDDHLTLEVCDNGVGFDTLAGYPGHLGLRSMRERAMTMGGTLEIVSAPDCGTQVRATIPVRVAQVA